MKPTVAVTNYCCPSPLIAWCILWFKSTHHINVEARYFKVLCATESFKCDTGRDDIDRRTPGLPEWCSPRLLLSRLVPTAALQLIYLRAKCTEDVIISSGMTTFSKRQPLWRPMSTLRKKQVGYCRESDYYVMSSARQVFAYNDGGVVECSTHIHVRYASSVCKIAGGFQDVLAAWMRLKKYEYNILRTH